MPEASLMAGATGIDKIASEVSKQKPASGGDSSFSKLLADKLDQSSRPEMGQKVMQSFDTSTLTPKSVSVEGVEMKPDAISSQQEIRSHGKVMDLLMEVNRNTLQMDNMIQVMSDGMTFPSLKTGASSLPAASAGQAGGGTGSFGGAKKDSLTNAMSKQLSPGDLLAMQWNVHLVVLQLDITGKSIEQFNAGAKQLLNTNFA